MTEPKRISMPIAIIPARGGSTRIKDKNIKDFQGKPIIAYSIQNAIETGIFEHVYVITDSEKIANVAKSHGAECPFILPSEMAKNDTGLTKVLLYTINRMNITQEYICYLLATAPLVYKTDLVKGFEMISAAEIPSCFSVTPFSFPILRSLYIDDENKLKMNWPEYEFTPSNNLRESYHDAGQFYWLNVSKFIKNESIYKDAMPIILPNYRVVDIDTLEDWERAKLTFKLIHLTR